MIEVTTKYSMADMARALRYHTLRIGLVPRLLRISFFALIFTVIWQLLVNCSDMRAITQQGYMGLSGFGLLFSYIFLIVVLFLLHALLYPWLVARSAFKDNTLLAEAQHRFVFAEDGFTVSTSGGGKDGTSELKYTELLRVCETEQYFYLYVQRDHSIVVNKSYFAAGDAERLHSILARR